MNLVFWPAPQPEQASKITKFVITKAPERTGTFVNVDSVAVPTSGAMTLQYIDSSGTNYDWYIIQSLDSQGNVLAQTDPHKGQLTTASMLDLLWRLRKKIGDISNPPCFPDYELVDKLHEGLTMHDRNKTWDTLDPEDELLILWIVTANICLTLAQDSSKYYPLAVDGVAVDKSQRVQHYTQLHDSLMKRYDEMKEKWHLEAERSGTIQESYMTRESGTTGRRVSYIHALPPQPVKLFVERTSSTSVDLRWTPSTDPGFYYYIIFRSTLPNQQKRFIEDIYHKRIALYEDPGDNAQALWGGITVPVRTIYRNSVVFWMDQNRAFNRDPYYSGPFQYLYPSSTYYYTIGVVNKNVLLALSNEATANTTAVEAPTIATPVRSADGEVIGLGVPLATVYLELSTDNGQTWNPLANATLATGTVPAFRFDVGASALTAGNQIRAYQVVTINNLTVQSAYTAPVTVI